jgi:4-hydroxy-tetrahydrodipicolinate reductase
LIEAKTFGVNGMNEKIRVIQCGLGPIGCATARLVAERDKLELVGAVDIDPVKVGKDVADVIGLDAPLGVEVKPSVGEIGASADVVLHTTNSPLRWILRPKRPVRPCWVPGSTRAS